MSKNLAVPTAAWINKPFIQAVEWGQATAVGIAHIRDFRPG
ncbi:hypothetical protein ACFVW2_36145 [Streptomyces sp. NPDC058171]